MTNTFAAIIVTLGTNWTTVGTFTPVNGGVPQEVHQGNVMTNTTAIVVWNGARHEMLVETQKGPECGERRVPKPPYSMWVTNAFTPYWGRSIVITNSIGL